MPLHCKRETPFALSRKDPSPAGHPGCAVLGQLVCFPRNRTGRANFSAIFHTTTLNSARLYLENKVKSLQQVPTPDGQAR